ncbi:MAG: N utilization substance protein B [Candidatus Binatia bacterium]
MIQLASRSGEAQLFFADTIMGTRREARERAVQFLFQRDVNPEGDLSEALERFWESQSKAAQKLEKGDALWNVKVELPPPTTAEVGVRAFAEPLVFGVLDNQERIDAEIVKHAANWSLERIAVVDRNILRLAIYEMFYRHDIPPVVTINEAVDIAKRFSTDESGKFVNGILDKIKASLTRPTRTST